MLRSCLNQAKTISVAMETNNNKASQFEALQVSKIHEKYKTGLFFIESTIYKIHITLCQGAVASLKTKYVF